MFLDAGLSIDAETIGVAAAAAPRFAAAAATVAKSRRFECAAITEIATLPRDAIPVKSRGGSAVLTSSEGRRTAGTIRRIDEEEMNECLSSLALFTFFRKENILCFFSENSSLMPWPTTKRRGSHTASATVLAIAAGGGEPEREQQQQHERPKTSSWLFCRREHASSSSSSLPRSSSSPSRVLLQGAAAAGNRDQLGESGVVQGLRTAREGGEDPLVVGAPIAPNEDIDDDGDEFFDAAEGDGERSAEKHQRSSSSSSSRLPRAPFPYAAHRAAFAGDAALCARLTLALGATTRERLAVDPRGATVLHVAAAAGRTEVVRALLDPPLSLPPAPLNEPPEGEEEEDGGGGMGRPFSAAEEDFGDSNNLDPDPDETDFSLPPPPPRPRWTPLDEAAAAGHPATARILAAAVARAAKAARAESRSGLARELAACPDVRFKVKWELTTSLPLAGHLLRRVAPRDEYTVWKRGAAVRIDGSLRGLEDGSSSSSSSSGGNTTGGGGGGETGSSSSHGGRGLLPEWRRGWFSVVWRAGEGERSEKEKGEEEEKKKKPLPPAAASRFSGGGIGIGGSSARGATRRDSSAATEFFESARPSADSEVSEPREEGEDDSQVLAGPAATEPLWALIDRERNSWIDLTAERRARARAETGGGGNGVGRRALSFAGPPSSSSFVPADPSSHSSSSTSSSSSAAAISKLLAEAGVRSKISASSGTRLRPARDWFGRVCGFEKFHGWRARPYDASLTLTAVTAKRAPVRYAALGGDCAPTKRRSAAADSNRGGGNNGSGGSGGGNNCRGAAGVTNDADSPRVLTYDDWLSASPNTDTVEEVPVDPLGAAGVPGRGSGSGGAAAAPALGARAWLTADCPVPASTVFSLLDLAGGAAPPLAAAGRLARRLCADGLLPVKLSVPLVWTLRVKLNLSDFVLLDGGCGGGKGKGEGKAVPPSAPSSSSSSSPVEANEPAALAASLERDPRAFFDLPRGCRRKTVRGLREERAARARAALAARRAAASAARGGGGGNNGRGSSLSRQASRASDGFPMSPLRDGYDDFEF